MVPSCSPPAPFFPCRHDHAVNVRLSVTLRLLVPAGPPSPVIVRPRVAAGCRGRSAVLLCSFSPPHFPTLMLILFLSLPHHTHRPPSGRGSTL